jgi:hypothetical protein
MSFLASIKSMTAVRPPPERKKITLIEAAQKFKAESEKIPADLNAERLKERARQKRLADNAEKERKKIRGNVDMKSFLAGRTLVHDPRSGILRPVEKGELEAKAPVIKAIVDDTPQPAERESTVPEHVFTTSRKTAASKAVLRRIQKPFEFGCANRAECNSSECNHGTEIDVCPLEKLVAQKRPAKTTTLLRCYLPDNPFIGMKFPLKQHVKKIPNYFHAQDALLTSRVQNDDHILEGRMSMQQPSLVDAIVHMRRCYHAELASIYTLESHTNEMNGIKFQGALEHAKRRRDENAIAELQSIYNRYCEAEAYKAQTSIAVLQSYFRSEIARVVIANSSRILFALPFSVTVAALFDILCLSDGERRGDAFYMALVNDVILGSTENVFLERRREEAEIARAAGAQPAYTPQSLPAAFVAQVNSIAPKHVIKTKLMKDGDEEEEDQEDDADAHSQKKRKSDEPTYLSKSLVCKSQTQVKNGSAACTAISFMCAMRFFAAEDMRGRMDDQVTIQQFVSDYIDYQALVATGAKIWTSWLEKHAKNNNIFMLPNEVMESCSFVVDTMNQLECKTREMAGPLVAQDGVVIEDDVHFTLDAALRACEAASSTFGAIFTVGLTSLSIGRIGGEYWMFDSHSDSPQNLMASLFRFDSRESIVDYLVTTRGSTYAPSKSLRESIESNSYSLFVLYKSK